MDMGHKNRIGLVQTRVISKLTGPIWDQVYLFIQALFNALYTT